MVRVAGLNQRDDNNGGGAPNRLEIGRRERFTASFFDILRSRNQRLSFEEDAEKFDGFRILGNPGDAGDVSSPQTQCHLRSGFEIAPPPARRMASENHPVAVSNVADRCGVALAAAATGKGEQAGAAANDPLQAGRAEHPTHQAVEPLWGCSSRLAAGVAHVRIVIAPAIRPVEGCRQPLRHRQHPVERYVWRCGS